jgi:hypothetical protein
MSARQGNVQALARLSGALYLMVILLGVSGEAIIRGSLVVFGDPAETARRILASEWLWRLGVVGQLVLLVCAIGMTFTWYMLFRPVNKPMALAATMFGLVSLAVESVSTMDLHLALSALTNAAHFPAAELAQLQAMSYMSLVSHNNAFGIALIFFGVQCVLVGMMIRQSGLLPRWVGSMMQVVGICYLINSFTRVMFPSFAGLLFPWILLPCLIGEVCMSLSLLIKGIDQRVWHATATERIHHA